MAKTVWRKLSIYSVAAQARALYGHFFEFPDDQAGFNKYIYAVIQKLISAAEVIQAGLEKSQESGEPTEAHEGNNQLNNCADAGGQEFDPRLMLTDEAWTEAACLRQFRAV